MSPHFKMSGCPLPHLLLMSAALGAAVFGEPREAAAQASIPEIHQAPADVDRRQGVVEPTAQQLGIVEALGASASWNQFGTPRSLINHDGFLATGLSGDPVAAAREWISANAALFRLSAQAVAGLELHRDARLAGSDGHAVIFRQRFGDLAAVHDGIITVGVVSGSIAYASSSLTGDSTLSGSVRLSPIEAWLAAAGDVGRVATALDVGGVKTDGEWTVFAVSGFAQPQRARLVALPTPQSGVRPAYETLLVDVRGGSATAFTSFIDADTGAALVRRNIVYQSHQPVNAFSGSVPQVDGACDADRGPFVVGAGESVRSVALTVEALLTTNDSVIHLKRDGVVVASQDTLFSPEALLYEPPGGVLSGSYTAQVCDFVDGFSWDTPNTYAGQIVFNPAGTGLPYPPEWKVFPASPRLDLLSEDTRQLWCWEAIVQGNVIPGCELELQNLAARVPWDHSVELGIPTFTTSGNAGHSAEAWTSPLTPGATGQRPLSPERRYDFAWGNLWAERRCAPQASGLGAAAGNDIFPAVANLFAMHNRMHDWAYLLGFTEENFNAQQNNFGNAGRDRDPLLGDAQAGAVDGGFPSFLGRDNANMIPLPDGVPPITNMYLWQPLRGAFYSPCVDGDFDMSVIGHEFTHLIESRMIGKGGSRSGHHAGAMGESAADFDAVEYMNEYGFVPVADENPFAVGPYVTGHKQRGIRNYGMNASPLNFSDMGYDITGPQVHADGEIWSATHFEIRQALIAKYDGSFPSSDAALQKDCADAKRPADQCPGNRRWIQLVYDAFLLMPVGPSMLDARDAILAADLMRFGGANQAELWLVFARRGFGKGAFSTNTAANTDTDPKPDFASPRHRNATLKFKAVAVDEGNAPITKARLYVGHYEARGSPVADTDPATNAGAPGANNLDDVAEFVAPGTYELVAQAPGHGHVRFTLQLNRAAARTVEIRFPTNWASQSKGATASGDGVRHADLIDDTEGTNWERTGATPDVGGTQVTVDLAGTVPRPINRVQVSALLRPGQNRFTSLRQFRIDASTDGTTFTPVFTSPAEAFPGAAPRPAAPDMILRTFSLPAVQATHLRLVVLTNQCTGNTQFQGVQDDDALNVTDCRTGQELTPPGSLAARDRDVRAAELQAFSSAGGVR